MVTALSAPVRALPHPGAPAPRRAPRPTRGRLHRVLAVLVTALALGTTTATAAQAAPGDLRATSTVTLSARPATLPATCATATPPVSPCGYGVIELTVRGFDTLGGIPDCAGVCSGWGGVGRNGAAGVTLQVRCSPTGASRYVRTTVPVTPVWPTTASSVGRTTTVDSDTVVLRAGFTLPGSSQLGACSGPTTVVRAWFTGASVVLDGVRGGSTTFRVAGSPQFAA